MKVLMIDDDADHNILMDVILNKIEEVHSHKVMPDATAALDYLSQISKEDFPNIIFVDLNMPDMDGIEFIEAFEKQFPELSHTTHVYMLTASEETEKFKEVMQHESVKQVITKPLTMLTFADILEHAMS